MVTLASPKIRTLVNPNGSFRLDSVSVRANPGELVNVQGNQLGAASGLTWEVTDGTFTGEATVVHEDRSKRLVTLRLPSGLAANEVYTLTASIGNLTASLAINDLILWWAKERVIAGGTGYIYGRNLNITGTPTVTFVDELDAETSVTVTASNPYRITYTVPSLSAGTYTIKVGNGVSTKTLAQTVNIVADISATFDEVVVSVADYGAVGDGVADDTAAINAAFAYVRTQVNPGSNIRATVNFPAGTYKVTATLLCYQDVKISGAGKATTVILGATPFTPTSGRFFDIRARDNIIQNMTLDASALTLSNSVLELGSNPTQTQVINVKIDAGNTSEPFTTNKGSHIEFTNCDFKGERGYIGSARQIFIDGGTFEGTKGVAHFFGWGMQDTSITGVTFTVSNVSAARCIVDQPFGQAMFNHYIAGNTSVNVVPPALNSNTGEQILYEPYILFNTDFSGHTIGTVGASNIQLFRVDSPEQHDWTYSVDKFDEAIGSPLIVKSGRGAGQQRVVTAVNSETNTFTIDRAWDVLPDATSGIEIGRSIRQAAIYNNTFDGHPDWVSTSSNNASTGVSFFSGARDVAVEGNTFTDLRAGVAITGRQSAAGLDIIGNTFTNTRDCFKFAQANADAPQFNVRIVGNTITDADNDIYLDFRGTGYRGEVFLSNLIFDENTFDGPVTFVFGGNAGSFDVPDFTTILPIPDDFEDWNVFNLSEGTTTLAMTYQGRSSVINTITGRDRPQTLIGGSWQDVITGGAEADTIDAGTREDTIYGSGGADTINLGSDSSADRVIYSAASQFGDTINQWSSNDRIDLRPFWTAQAISEANRANYHTATITTTETVLRYFAAGDAPSGSSVIVATINGNFTGSTLDSFLALT